MVKWNRAHILLLAAVLLAACAPAAQTAAAPTRTAKPLTPTITSQPSTTALPSVTPTSAPTGTPTPNPTPASPQIAFASNSQGNWDIYRANLDGSGLTQLTQYTGDETSPAWSPDGLMLLYQARIGTTWQIMRMNWDGSGTEQLTTQGSNRNPTFSPDGAFILFDSDRSGSQDIYLMDADGANQHALTASPANQYTPVWSADGGTIAYLSDENASQEICVQSAAGKCPQEVFFMTPDGRYLRKIESLKREIGRLAWSPDSQSLAVIVPYFKSSEIAMYDRKTLTLNPFLSFSGLLETIYQNGASDFQLRSFSYSPAGNNGLFCARQEISEKTGPRSLISGCYLLGIDENLLYTVIRSETAIYADSDLANAAEYAGATWRP